MKKVSLVSRYLLGLIYFVFGLNGFLNFIPMPAEVPERAMKFSMAMMETGYFFPMIKGTEVAFGLLLLIGFASPLALVVLAPVTINILLFHGVLTPGVENIILPVVMVVLHALAAVNYWPRFKGLFAR